MPPEEKGPYQVTTLTKLAEDYAALHGTDVLDSTEYDGGAYIVFVLRTGPKLTKTRKELTREIDELVEQLEAEKPRPRAPKQAAPPKAKSK